ncbi:hypothetical protein [Comamonas testosteroni]|uniref:hypothetical protein n=1 Tax=Comamonas testosteroni TaxID=285 RepID=UPI0012D2D229|nr:hypothetical protein [Comamonas testosteroni]
MRKISVIGCTMAAAILSMSSFAQTNNYVSSLSAEERQARDSMLTNLESELNGGAVNRQAATATMATSKASVSQGPAMSAPPRQVPAAAVAQVTQRQVNQPQVPSSAPIAGARPAQEQSQGQVSAKAQRVASPQSQAAVVTTAPPTEQAASVPVLTASMPKEAIRAGEGYASDFDTFGDVLRKQAELEKSAFEARISSNRKQAGIEVEKPPVNPLANAKQLVINSEPVLEALWGIEGREVAEVSYKGEQIPVSKTNPVVSAKDGWELEDISQFQVTFVKKLNSKVLKRKVIPLSWSGEIFNNARINY